MNSVEIKYQQEQERLSLSMRFRRYALRIELSPLPFISFIPK